jgi:hypothetical protein
MKNILPAFLLFAFSLSAANVPADFPTIQAAVNAAATGDVIQLAPGLYNEDVTTKYAQPGVTIEGAGDATIISRLTVTRPDWKVRKVKFAGTGKVLQWWAYVDVSPGAHRLLIEDVVVDATGSQYVDAISWSTNGISHVPFPPEAASDCIIRRCRVTGVTGRMTLNLLGNRNVVEDCRFHDVIQSDFVRVFGDGNTIRRCVFDGNRLAPEGTVGFHADFIQTFGSNTYGSRNHVIEDCVIKNIEGQITQFEENQLAGTGAMGGWTFRRNLFTDITLGCSHTIASMKWLNNTFVRCSSTGGHVLNFGNGPRGTSNGLVIHNNIFLDCGKMVSNEQGWYGDGTVDLVNYAQVQYVANYNYYGKGPTFEPARSDVDERGIKFRWAELNGINGGDPKLSADFRLTAGSPLIAAGKDGVDIGAYAFAAVPEDPPPPPDDPPPPPPPPPVTVYRARLVIEASVDGAEWTQESETIIPVK